MLGLVLPCPMPVAKSFPSPLQRRNGPQGCADRREAAVLQLLTRSQLTQSFKAPRGRPLGLLELLAAGRKAPMRESQHWRCAAAAHVLEVLEGASRLLAVSQPHEILFLDFSELSKPDLS